MPDERSLRGQTIQVDVEIGPGVPPGVYSLRILSPDGHLEPASASGQFRAGNHRSAESARYTRDAPELRWPVIVNGRLDKPGAFNLYSFQVSEGQELDFEVFSRPAGTRPQTSWFKADSTPSSSSIRPGGSWFDPDRLAVAGLQR